MEYENEKPVLKQARRNRDAAVRKRARSEQENGRGKQDKPDALGVTQGQNGEQGNSTDPRHNQPIGRPGEE